MNYLHFILLIVIASHLSPSSSFRQPSTDRPFSPSTMSDSVATTERRLSSLLMNSGQPQEGSLKHHSDADEIVNVREIFPDTPGRPSNSEQPLQPTTIESSYLSPSEFRKAVRTNQYTTPTNGICPGYWQANLIVLDEKYAFDFLLFCQKNERACPLIEVLDLGCFEPNCGVGSDLRVDVPK